MNKQFKPTFAFFDDNGINISFNCGDKLIKLDFYNNEELLIKYFANVWNLDASHAASKLRNLKHLLHNKPIHIADSVPELSVPESSIHTTIYLD